MPGRKERTYNTEENIMHIGSTVALRTCNAKLFCPAGL